MTEDYENKIFDQIKKRYCREYFYDGELLMSVKTVFGHIGHVDFWCKSFSGHNPFLEQVETRIREQIETAIITYFNIQSVDWWELS